MPRRRRTPVPILIALLLAAAQVSAAPSSPPTTTVNLGGTANLTYTPELPAGWSGFAKIDWLPETPTTYRIFLIVPPEGWEVNNSLTPLVASASARVNLPNVSTPHPPRRVDPTFTWVLRPPPVEVSENFTFTIIDVSATYEPGLTLQVSRLPPAAASIVAQLRVTFTNASIQAHEFTVSVVNLTGLRLSYQRELEGCRAETQRFASRAQQAEGELASCQANLRTMQSYVSKLNKTYQNVSQLATKWFRQRQSLVGVLYFSGIFNMLIGVPYIIYRINKARIIERFRPRWRPLPIYQTKRRSIWERLSGRGE